MSETVTLTRDQLDEYTRRVVEATYDDLRGEKQRARKAAAALRRQEAKRDLVLSRLEGWERDALRYVENELVCQTSRSGLTVAEIVRRADRRQATERRRNAARRAREHERRLRDIERKSASPVRLPGGGYDDGTIDRMVLDWPPLTERTAERIAAIFGGPTAGESDRLRDSIREELHHRLATLR